MRREVEKNPLAVLEMKEPGQLPTSSLMLWMPSTIANPPARMHTPAGGRKGGREGRNIENKHLYTATSNYYFNTDTLCIHTHSQTHTHTHTQPV